MKLFCVLQEVQQLFNNQMSISVVVHRLTICIYLETRYRPVYLVFFLQYLDLRVDSEKRVYKKTRAEMEQEEEEVQ
jgi:hypothetical protein